MPFPFSSVNTAPKPFFIISFLLILSHGFITVTTKAQNENNGADPFRTACAEWEIPTEAKPMRIAVPSNSHYQNFVKVNLNEALDEKKYEGFCIDIFKEVVNVLFLEKNYTLHYKFEAASAYEIGTQLKGVASGTFDAAVGDFTILADRLKLFEFTQPYMESRLVMIAPAKSQHKAWKFLKPFTVEMWIATGVILIYTMFIVWSLEHGTNPEFKGPLKDQLSTALWFTFSSLFFSHRERVHSNFTRVVVVVWLFVVLILSTNYTANLSAMFTVSQLKPKVTSIEELKKTNSTIGCDGDSFVLKFLKSEYGLQNVKEIRNGNEYVKLFESGNISAAIIELPYAKDFMSRYGKGYIMTEPIYKRLGGLGFVFKKGSPIATNVSEAILTLLENKTLKMLEYKWFGNTFEHSDLEAADKDNHESLSLKSFWGLYIITFATSTILVLIHLLKNYQYCFANFSGILSFQGFWDHYLVINASSAILFLIHLLRNYRRRPVEYVNPSNTPRNLQASPATT